MYQSQGIFKVNKTCERIDGKRNQKGFASEEQNENKAVFVNIFLDTVNQGK